jgi:hypothetical protein
MKRIGLSIIVSTSLLITSVNASSWDTFKEGANKAMFWKDKHLQEIDFKHMYPRAVYQTSYFGFAITATAILGAGAFTYFTAGAGAPAAATGAAVTASWVAGGGSGSYMAGLSTIGGYVGGNAIVGASILNGVSIGVIGGTTVKFATLGLVARAGIMASITAATLDGVVYFKNPDTGLLQWKVIVNVPRNLGSKSTRSIVDKLHSLDEEILEAIEDKNETKYKEIVKAKEENYDYAIKLLRKTLESNENNQEDLIVLCVIAANNSQYTLFSNAMDKLKNIDVEDKGFLNYLFSLQALYKGDLDKTKYFSELSMDENTYALEPVILNINILGQEDFSKNEERIEYLVKRISEEYDSDDYVSQYSLASINYRVGTLYFINERYSKAEEYYRKAYDELGILQKNFFGKELKHVVELGIANSLYKQGKVSSAKEMFDDILNDIDSEENSTEVNRIRDQYIGSNK